MLYYPILYNHCTHYHTLFHYHSIINNVYGLFVHTNKFIPLLYVPLYHTLFHILFVHTLYHTLSIITFHSMIPWFLFIPLCVLRRQTTWTWWVLCRWCGASIRPWWRRDVEYVCFFLWPWDLWGFHRYNQELSIPFICNHELSCSDGPGYTSSKYWNNPIGMECTIPFITSYSQL